MTVEDMDTRLTQPHMEGTQDVKLSPKLTMKMKTEKTGELQIEESRNIKRWLAHKHGKS